MEKLVSILSKASSDDVVLLVELLKKERKEHLSRIERQRKQIVELTASRNELLAQKNGISENELEQLKDHLAEVVENSKKMSKTLEQYNEEIIRREEELECKDITVRALRNRVSELEKQMDANVSKPLNGVFEEMTQDVDDFIDGISKTAKK